MDFYKTLRTLRIMATRRVELGPTGQTVRLNVRRLREAAGLTLREVSEATSALGRPLSVATLSQVETGARRVDVDDLVVLSIALRASPNALLLPNDARHGQQAQLTLAVRVDVDDAWDWVEHTWPLHEIHGLDGDDVTDDEVNRVAMDFALRVTPIGRFDRRVESMARETLFAGLDDPERARLEAIFNAAFVAATTSAPPGSAGDDAIAVAVEAAVAAGALEARGEQGEAGGQASGER